jgi:hypothetical protein
MMKQTVAMLLEAIAKLLEAVACWLREGGSRFRYAGSCIADYCLLGYACMQHP